MTGPRREAEWNRQSRDGLGAEHGEQAVPGNFSGVLVRMFKAYRCVLVAAFGWVILGAAVPPNESAQPKQNESAANIKGLTAGAANTQATMQPGEQAKSSQYEAPCGPNEYNAKSDLCAQWYAARAAGDAADWSYWGLWVGVGSLALSAFGLIAVVISLRQTREALVEARNANHISEKSARQSLRAFVGGADFKIENFLANEAALSTWTLKNFGDTIAHDVQVVADAFITPPDNEKIRFRHTFVLKRDVLPGEEWSYRYYWPVQPDADAIRGFYDHRVSCIYAGVIRYRDAYGVRRYTTFKKKVGVQNLDPKTGSGNMLNCIRGNGSN